MFKKKDNVGKDFTRVLKVLGKMDPDEVKGFIILVRGKDHEDGKTADGVNAVYGEENVLLNLLGNMNQDLIKDYVKADLLRRIMSEE